MSTLAGHLGDLDSKTVNHENYVPRSITEITFLSFKKVFFRTSLYIFCYFFNLIAGVINTFFFFFLHLQVNKSYEQKHLSWYEIHHGGDVKFSMALLLWKWTKKMLLQLNWLWEIYRELIKTCKKIINFVWGPKQKLSAWQHYWPAIFVYKGMDLL